MSQKSAMLDLRPRSGISETKEISRAWSVVEEDVTCGVMLFVTKSR